MSEHVTPLNPVIARAVAGAPPSTTTPPDYQAIRAAEAAAVPPREERTPALSRVEDRETSDAPLRVFVDHPEWGVRGVIVYCHGGAYLSGSLDSHDHLCRKLAAATGRTVVAVGFSHAPEEGFPVALEQCDNVIDWVREHRDALLWDGAELTVAGDSSGGGMAAALAAADRDSGRGAITHQMLFYPALDLRLDQSLWPSLTENAVGYGLEYNKLVGMLSYYLRTADPNDPRVSPVLRQDLSGLPAALVITAGYDPLRDEGEDYAARLAEAGVPTTALTIEDANHGFLLNFGDLPEYAALFDTARDFLDGETT